MAEENDKRRLIIVSGLSGAGKSVVLNTLEDLDFYCVDNLPMKLLDNFNELFADEGSDMPGRVAVGIDARNPVDSLNALVHSISRLKENGINVELIFMDAGDDELTKRYSETRRKHPLSSDTVSLRDAIEKERSILNEVYDAADLRIDTSHTVVHELRSLVHDRIARRTSAELSLQFLSFGFKRGVPGEADFVFDVRCLPNPHWDKTLRPYTGKDAPVVSFLSKQAKVVQMQEHLISLLDYWVPEFEAENRSYLCIAIGCTGGHHRSVYLVEQLAKHFGSTHDNVIIRHRDL